MERMHEHSYPIDGHGCLGCHFQWEVSTANCRRWQHGVVLDKPKADWNDDDKMKVQYDLKARNILISSPGVN